MRRNRDTIRVILLHTTEENGVLLWYPSSNDTNGQISVFYYPPGLSGLLYELQGILLPGLYEVVSEKKTETRPLSLQTPVTSFPFTQRIGKLLVETIHKSYILIISYRVMTQI